MAKPFKPDDLDDMRNNPENYKWGVFYYNPLDSRIILPKRNKILGWTLNFASPYAYLILFGIILVAAIITIVFPS